jgi:hypothetical protein
MNDKIVAGVLMALAGAMLVGILYVVFAPVPDAIGADASKEAERLRAPAPCAEAPKERDYKVAGYKVAKCPEQPTAERPKTR